MQFQKWLNKKAINYVINMNEQEVGKNIELLNSNDDYLFLRSFCHGIDAKRINFLKRHGFSISSIYPRNSSITKYNNFPMLEIFLKSKIKGINKN